MKLYSSESPTNHSLITNFLKSLDFPELADTHREILDAPFSKEEISAAIFSLQSGKSPGPDGFLVEFFKSFAPQLVPLLHSVLSEAFTQGKLCIIQANFAFDVDFKIQAKVLAHRLERVLPAVISEDQSGFVKGRHPFFNIRRLLNILHTPSKDTPECVLSLDAEKAFDRVEWNYLFAVLERFGLGPNFISWIKYLYLSPVASVCTNSQKSKPF